MSPTVAGSDQPDRGVDCTPLVAPEQAQLRDDLTSSTATLRSSHIISHHDPPKLDSTSTLVACTQEEVRPSTTRLLFAHIGAALTLFLATTDATIVSTILPTIVKRFGASSTQYTWVSVTYMLTQTAFQPLYGKVSDLIGRTTVLYGSIFIFAAGSALCGTAQSIHWLIIARAIGGIGGGGIVSSVWTITSEIVDAQNQAKWSQALSVTWACSAIAGPILGGAFSEQSGVLSWRWAFFLNLPICAAATLVLWLSLRHVKLGYLQGVSWRTFLQTFDFLGLFLFMGGSSCIVIGFNVATAIGWRTPPTISLIVLGLIILICAGFYEVRTKRDALFPLAIFKDPTIIIVLVVIFLHNFAFNAGTFYLALFFQAVENLTPLQSGIKMLPYSLGSSLASMPTAWFIGYWQKQHADTSGQRAVMFVGLFIATLGFGVMTLLNTSTTPALRSVYPLIAGIGIGMLFHAPYQVFTRALRRKDTASGTSAFFLVRFTGATVGLTIAGAIFDSRLSQTLPKGIPASTVLANLHSANASRFPNLTSEIVNAVSLSIRTIWAVCCPCLAVAALITLCTRNLSSESDDSSRQEKTGSTFMQSSDMVLANEASIQH